MDSVKSPQPSIRSERVAEEIRRILTELFQKGKVKNKVLFDISLVITEVKCAPDLTHATVYFYPLAGRGNIDIILKALKDSEGFFRGVIGKEMHIRVIPKLVFKFETLFDKTAELETLLHSPDVKRDLG